MNLSTAHPCEVCQKPADVLVRDSEELEPQAGPDGRLYARTRNVGPFRGYCDAHAQPPKRKLLTGEVVELVGR